MGVVHPEGSSRRREPGQPARTQEDPGEISAARRDLVGDRRPSGASRVCSSPASASRSPGPAPQAWRRARSHRSGGRHSQCRQCTWCTECAEGGSAGPSTGRPRPLPAPWVGCGVRRLRPPAPGCSPGALRAGRGGCCAPGRRGRWLGGMPPSGMPPRAVRPARGGADRRVTARRGRRAGSVRGHRGCIPRRRGWRGSRGRCWPCVARSARRRR